MSNLEMKVDALMRFVVAPSGTDRERAKAELFDLMDGKTPPAPFDTHGAILEALLELGVPDHLIGHSTLIRAIELVVEEPLRINDITKGLYPAVAKDFNSTPSRVERSIRHAIEVCWTRGDYEVLTEYFGNTVDPDRGKPTNGEFIARMANIIRAKKRRAS